METIKTEFKQNGLSMEVDREQFAMALKTWRLRQGMTQKEVGKKWGFSRFTILRIEKAESVSWPTAYRVFAKLSQELMLENQKQ